MEPTETNETAEARVVDSEDLMPRVLDFLGMGDKFTGNTRAVVSKLWRAAADKTKPRMSFDTFNGISGTHDRGVGGDSARTGRTERDERVEAANHERPTPSTNVKYPILVTGGARSSPLGTRPRAQKRPNAFFFGAGAAEPALPP